MHTITMQKPKNKEASKLNPFYFVRECLNTSGEAFNASVRGFYYKRAKDVIAHLKTLNWTDLDILFHSKRIIMGLKNRNLPCHFSYFTTILLNLNRSIAIKSVSEAPSEEMQEWIDKEIERIVAKK